MITDLATTITAQLPTAAAAAALAWDLEQPLTAGAPVQDAADVDLAGQAVLVEFSGHGKGELVVVASPDIVAHLMESAAQPPDVLAALGPAITAACLALGNASPDSMQAMDPKMALRRVLALGESAAVFLSDEDGDPQAALAVGMEKVAEAPSAHRLDMLRGVQMQATVELGRASMTINDLLGLHAGAVIELDRAAGAPADLYVNGRLIARGEVVVVDENYGLRIMQVLSDEAGR